MACRVPGFYGDDEVHTESSERFFLKLFISASLESLASVTLSRWASVVPCETNAVVLPSLMFKSNVHVFTFRKTSELDNKRLLALEGKYATES
jgi:hypothetical protein